MNTRHDWITARPRRTDGQPSFVGNGHRLGQNDASVRVDETLLSFCRSEGPIDESPSSSWRSNSVRSLIESPSSSWRSNSVSMTASRETQEIIDLSSLPETPTPKKQRSSSSSSSSASTQKKKATVLRNNTQSTPTKNTNRSPFDEISPNKPNVASSSAITNNASSNANPIGLLSSTNTFSTNPIGWTSSSIANNASFSTITNNASSSATTNNIDECELECDAYGYNYGALLFGKYDSTYDVESLLRCGFSHSLHNNEHITNLVLPTMISVANVKAIMSKRPKKEQDDREYKYYLNQQPIDTFVINAKSKQIIGYCGALFDSISGLDCAAKVLNTSEQTLGILGVKEVTLRDNRITGILVYRDVAIVGGAHLPELLKYHGEDPSTSKSAIIQRVTTANMKSQLQTIVDAGKKEKAKFVSGGTSIGRYMTRKDDEGWSDTTYNSLSVLAKHTEWFSGNLIYQYSPPVAVWKKAGSTKPSKGKLFAVTGPLVQAATELDPENGLTWVMIPSHQNRYSSSKYSIKMVCSRSEYEEDVFGSYYRNAGLSMYAAYGGRQSKHAYVMVAPVLNNRGREFNHGYHGLSCPFSYSATIL